MQKGHPSLSRATEKGDRPKKVTSILIRSGPNKDRFSCIITSNSSTRPRLPQARSNEAASRRPPSLTQKVATTQQSQRETCYLLMRCAHQAPRLPANRMKGDQEAIRAYQRANAWQPFRQDGLFISKSVAKWQRHFSGDANPIRSMS